LFVRSTVYINLIRNSQDVVGNQVGLHDQTTKK